MANVEKEAVEAMPSEAERSVNDPLIEISRSIGRAIGSYGLTPNQELDLCTALISVLKTVAIGIIGGNGNVKIETIQ